MHLLLQALRLPLISNVVGDDGVSALVLDARRPGEDVVGHDRSLHTFAEAYLRFVFRKRAAADHHCSAGCLDGGSTFLLPIPLHERAIGKADGSFAVDLGDLVAWAPI